MQNKSAEANMTKPNPIVPIGSATIPIFKRKRIERTQQKAPTHSNRHHSKNAKEVKHSKLQASKSCGILVNIQTYPHRTMKANTWPI